MKRNEYLYSGIDRRNEIQRVLVLARKIAGTSAAAVAIAATPMIATVATAGEFTDAKDTIEQAARSDESALDSLWSLATLYENQSDPLVQKIKLRGRYQGQYHWLDSAQGDDDGWEDRRSRIGFDIDFLDDFSFRGDVQGSDGFDPVYNGIVDFYIKWKPSKAFNVTVGKQKPKIGYYDWLQSTNTQPTFERSQIFNQLRVDRSLGVVVDGRQGNWLYRTGIYSNDSNLEFGNLDAAAAYSAGTGFDFSDLVGLDRAEWHLDYLHSDIEANSTVLDRYKNIVSTTLWLEDGPWGLVGEVFAANGRSPDAAGFFLQPTYDLIPDKLQLVGRYSFASGGDPDALVAQRRYERAAPALTGGGQGEVYHSFYLGAQHFLYGDKLKVLAGAEYATLDGGGNGGDYDGWTFLTGVRLHF